MATNCFARRFKRCEKTEISFVSVILSLYILGNNYKTFTLLRACKVFHHCPFTSIYTETFLLAERLMLQSGHFSSFYNLSNILWKVVETESPNCKSKIIYTTWAIMRKVAYFKAYHLNFGLFIDLKKEHYQK